MMLAYAIESVMCSYESIRMLVLFLSTILSTLFMFRRTLRPSVSVNSINLIFHYFSFRTTKVMKIGGNTKERCSSDGRAPTGR